MIARVNGQDITKADFERALRSIEQRAGGPVPEQRRDEIYRGLLEQLVRLQLLKQEAAARKVTVPDADVDKRLAEIQQQFPSEDVFKQMLATQKITLEKFRADQRQDLVVAKMLTDALKDKVAATPEQIADFYKKNPDRFKQGERVRASHILITVPQGADGITKARLAKGRRAAEEGQGRRDFAALAKQNSQDPGSAVQGGDLGYFQPGQMVGPFDQVAFKLAPGSVSDLVETQFGFHIIKVVDKQAGAHRAARRSATRSSRSSSRTRTASARRRRSSRACAPRARSKSSSDRGPMRVDAWLDVACLYKTRSEAKRGCEGGKVEVNGEHAKPHRAAPRGRSRPHQPRPSGAIRT